MSEKKNMTVGRSSSYQLDNPLADGSLQDIVSRDDIRFVVQDTKAPQLSVGYMNRAARRRADKRRKRK